MDIRKSIRKDSMGNMLRKFAHDAQAIDAPPEEVVAALVDMAGSIYAVELSGAITRFEKKQARAAFMRGHEQAMVDLPTAAEDAAIEARLKNRGL